MNHSLATGFNIKAKSKVLNTSGLPFLCPPQGIRFLFFNLSIFIKIIYLIIEALSEEVNLLEQA
jgi:hypothetical protein